MKLDRSHDFKIGMRRSVAVDQDRFKEVTRNMRGHVASLDIIRAVAVTWVIIHNFESPPEMEGIYEGVLGRLFSVGAAMGWVGVQLFFVLSGFLITGSLVDAKGKQNAMRNFYARRVLRIFPIFYVTLFVLLVLVPVIVGTPSWLTLSVDNQVWYWLYLSNWVEPLMRMGGPGMAHLWTLAVEEQFYLLWPLCVLFIDRTRLVWVCLLLILSAFLFRAAVTLGILDLPLLSAYVFTIARWDALAIGGLLAIAIRNPIWFNRLDSNAEKILLVGGAYILVVLFVTHDLTPTGDLISVVTQTVAAILSAYLIYRSITPGWMGRVFSGGGVFVFVRRVGLYSYAMYLFHRPLQYAWHSSYRLEASGDFALGIQLYNILVVFSLSFILAAISWQVIEQPLLKLKSYFRYSGDAPEEKIN